MMITAAIKDRRVLNLMYAGPLAGALEVFISIASVIPRPVSIPLNMVP